jgi:PadR family transcriptional regulator, regulatory protein PadR
MTRHLGEFEQIVLFALVRLDGDVHGVAVAEEIEARTGRSVSPGALYTALERLEARGLVHSWIGDSTPERGGRRRRCYRLEPEGARALQRTYETLRRMAAGTSPKLADLAGGEGAP